jgi:hypothetical protein
LTNKLTKNQRLKIKFDDYFEEGIIPALQEKEYNYNFKSFKTLKSNKLPYIYDVSHFCSVSNFSEKQVKYFLIKKEKAYVTFSFPKKLGASGK